MNRSVEVVISVTGPGPGHGQGQCHSNLMSIFSGTSTSGMAISKFHHVSGEAINGWNADYSLMIKAFQAVSNPDAHVIIVKEPLITGLSSRQILDVIDDTITLQYDILYMASWMDRCDLYTDVSEIANSQIRIVQTMSPNGFIAVCISPRGREKFMRIFDPQTSPLCTPLNRALNALIGKTLPESERFLAMACYPNIVEFDTSRRESDAELFKTNRCRQPEQIYVRRETRNERGLGMWVFLIIFIVTILAIMFFASIHRRHMNQIRQEDWRTL